MLLFLVWGGGGGGGGVNKVKCSLESVIFVFIALKLKG